MSKPIAQPDCQLSRSSTKVALTLFAYAQGVFVNILKGFTVLWFVVGWIILLGGTSAVCKEAGNSCGNETRFEWWLLIFQVLVIAFAIATEVRTGPHTLSPSLTSIVLAHTQCQFSSSSAHIYIILACMHTAPAAPCERAIRYMPHTSHCSLQISKNVLSLAFKGCIATIASVLTTCCTPATPAGLPLIPSGQAGSKHLPGHCSNTFHVKGR